MNLKEEIEHYVGQLLAPEYPRKKEVVAYIEKGAQDQIAKVHRKFIEDLDEGQVFEACRAVQLESRPRRPYTRRVAPAPNSASNGDGKGASQNNGDS
jgi:hypothetical protein